MCAPSDLGIRVYGLELRFRVEPGSQPELSLSCMSHASPAVDQGSVQGDSPAVLHSLQMILNTCYQEMLNFHHKGLDPKHCLCCYFLGCMRSQWCFDQQ